MAIQIKPIQKGFQVVVQLNDGTLMVSKAFETLTDAICVAYQLEGICFWRSNCI
jgi:hypothetical protein